VTPEENRRRLARARTEPTKAHFKNGHPHSEVDALLTPQDMIYAAKMHRPGGSKDGRKPKSHVTGGATRLG
jgi:hypothetical protein